MILWQNVEYFWLYFWDDKTWKYKDMYLKEKELKEYNKLGYNIYFILNDFYEKRTIENVVWFNYFWIDLDYFKGDVEDILENCENLLWFIPSRINKTYKWYHLLFELDENLYNLDTVQYQEIYKRMNEYLDWDVQMKDITGILKQEGYIDNKWERNFEITCVFNNNQNIWFEEVELFYWQPLKFVDRAEKFKVKSEKKKRASDMLMKIDWLSFIKSINNNPNVFNNIKISVDWGKIDWTSGLRLYEKSWFNIIKDFTDKKRFGNRFFLYNYIIKEKLWITDYSKKESKVILNKIMWWLNSEFWISYNRKLNMLPLVDAKFQTNMNKNTLVLEDWKGLDVDILNDYNTMVLSFWKKWEIEKLITAINMLVYKNDLDLNKGIMIKEKDLIEVMGLSMFPENIKQLRRNILLLSNLNTLDIFIDWLTWMTEKKYRRLFDFSILEKNWVAKRNYNVNKKLYVWENLIAMFKKSEHYHLAHTISTTISQFWSYSFNLPQTMDNMWIKDKRVILWILDKMKEEGYVKWFEQKNETIYVNRKKEKEIKSDIC